MAMLDVQDISTFYGNIQALKGVSLHVEQGEIVTLIGSNGAGKTTTLQTISGLLKPRTGSISSQRPGDQRQTGPCRGRDGRGARAGRPPHLQPDVGDGESGARRLRPRQTGSSRSRPGLQPVPPAGRAQELRSPGRCPVASSRCWRSAGR